MSPMIFRVFFACLLLLPFGARAADTITVFAAASLTNAMQDIATLWMAGGHPKVVFSFESSGTLAQQIAHGAPANVFVSADEKWMDDLAKRHALLAASRSDLVGNSLVVVEPKQGLKPVKLGAGSNLLAVLGPDGRLAVGDPAHVPAGIYARQARQKMGLWQVASARLAPADSVRAALRLVELGEAPAGIVYGTDVKVTPSLGIAGIFPPDTHDPIRYPVAVLKAHNTAAARDFVAFLHTQPAQDVFLHWGFTAP